VERSTVSILIVEDEAIIAQNIERMLNRMGYRVCGICSRSEEVIPAIRDERPTVVLMDICIEGKEDGVTLAERIRERFGIPLVYLTALMDDQTLQRAKITQPFGYVAKPFSQRELEITLEIALYKLKVEKRIAEQEIQIQHLIDNIHQGFCLVDTNGLIRYSNKRLTTLLDVEASKLIGRKVAEFIDLPQDLSDERFHALENQEPFEADLYTLKGRNYKVIVTPELLGNKDTGQGYFLGITNLADIARRNT